MIFDSIANVNKTLHIVNVYLHLPTRRILHTSNIPHRMFDNDAWSAEKLMTKDTPRAYVGYSTNDSVVPQEYNGKAMCTALQQAGVEHCAKEYAEGGHSINWPDFPSCMHQCLKTF
jgi:hypothetical protein